MLRITLRPRFLVAGEKCACPTVTTNNYHFRNKSSAYQASESSGELPSRGASTQFRRADRGSFFQKQPTIGNVYGEDTALQSYVRRMLPKSVLHEIEPDLDRFGARVGSEIHEVGLDCERNLPKHVPFDAWGNRIDQLLTSDAWKRQKQIAAEEGIVAIPYENRHGPWSRVHQVAKHMLYSSSSGLYSCPLAMTDGAMQFFRGSSMTASNSTFANAFARLMSRDPSKFWTSGQWMTERRGGSDVVWLSSHPEELMEFLLTFSIY